MTNGQALRACVDCMAMNRPLRSALAALASVFGGLLVGCSSLPDRHTVQVGTTPIAYSLTGPASATPIVVLQSGLGDGMGPWAALVERLSPELRVFAYDRPGYGDSGGLPSAARSPCVIATELRETLRGAGLAPPYLLVGHSIGGQYQFAFARLFPGEVAGLLLLDPTHPDHWPQMQRRAAGVAAMVSGLRAAAFTPAMRAEFDAQGSCLEAPRRLADGIPTRVLARTRYALTETDDFKAMAHELEQDWLRILPGSTLRRVEDASHYIHKDQPAEVARELRAMVKEAQAQRR
jgi:pimeloyl-ACP methyl ester carboxylesterase